MMKSFTMGALFALVNAVEIEREPLLSWAPTKCWPPQSSPCEKDIKRDYFVPNFGKDHEIAANDGSLAWAEKYLKHHWIPAEKPKPEDPIMYAGKDTPLDGDMVASLKHLEQMEKKHGAWNLPPQDD